MRSREYSDEYRAVDQKTGDPVMMMKVKEVLNVDRIEL